MNTYVWEVANSLPVNESESVKGVKEHGKLVVIDAQTGEVKKILGWAGSLNFLLLAVTNTFCSYNENSLAFRQVW